MCGTGPLITTRLTLPSYMRSLIKHTSWDPVAQTEEAPVPAIGAANLLMILSVTITFSWPRIIDLSQHFNFLVWGKKIQKAKRSEKAIHFPGELGISHTTGMKWLLLF